MRNKLFYKLTQEVCLLMKTNLRTHLLVVSAKNQNTLKLLFRAALLRAYVSQLVLAFTISRSFLLISSAVRM